MDLVDEQDVVRFQIGQDRRQVARALEHRARRLAQVDAHLARNDVGQRGLAQTRRAKQQRVVERFLALARSGDEDLKLVADFFLADVFVQVLRPQGAFDRFLVGRSAGGSDDALFRKIVGLDTHCI